MKSLSILFVNNIQNIIAGRATEVIQPRYRYSYLGTVPYYIFPLFFGPTIRNYFYFAKLKYYKLLLHKTGRLSKKWAPLSETRHLYPELIQYIM